MLKVKALPVLFFQKVGLSFLIFWLFCSFCNGSGSKSGSGTGRHSGSGYGSTYLRMWATCSVLEEKVSSVSRISSVMVFNTDLMVSEGKYPLITTQSISEFAKKRISEWISLKTKNTMLLVGNSTVSYFNKENPTCQKDTDPTKLIPISASST